MRRPLGAPHQVDVDVVVVELVGARRQHRGELVAGRALDVAQEALLLRRAAPAVLDGDAVAVGEHEGRDVERVAEGVLGDRRTRLPVHAAAGIGRDLLDLDDRLAEPLQRRGLHRAGDPAVERRDDRTGERRRGLHLDRRGRRDRLALRAERGQRPRALRRDRRRRCARPRIGRQLVIVALRMRRRAARLRLLIGLLRRRVVRCGGAGCC